MVLRRRVLASMMESETQKQPFKAVIKCSQQYQVGVEVVCQFVITNQDTVDYYLLKWHTPLEGMKTSYLSVSKDGHSLLYRGRMVKRGKPQPGDYVLVKAGESVSNEVDIATGFNLSEPGMYEMFMDASVSYQSIAPGSSQASEEKWQTLISPPVTIELSAKT